MHADSALWLDTVNMLCVWRGVGIEAYHGVHGCHATHGQGLRQRLHLQLTNDEVVPSVLQQLFFEVLRRVQVFARRVFALAFTL
jgi:hypothetical protein